MRDHYFDEWGQHLGQDDAPTNFMRVISQINWNHLKKDSRGRVNNLEASVRSVLFSYATLIDVPGASYNGPMPDFAVLNVYRWVNDNFILISLNPQKLWINNSLSRGELAQIQTTYENKILNYDVGINSNYMAVKGYCDNIYNIASVLSHETGHKDAYVADPVGEYNKSRAAREYPQYVYQMEINPYWAYTIPAFQTAIWNSYYYYKGIYYSELKSGN